MTLPRDLTNATVPPEKWAGLVALLATPGAGRVLIPTGGRNQAAPADAGNADTLMRTAPAGSAVVAPVRSDLIAIDLDNTGWLLPALQDAAGQFGAVLVYLAASGSADSLHAVYAATTRHGHDGLLSRVEQLRQWSGVEAGTVEVRGRAGLRMPGSVSLKPDGGPVVPVDADTLAEIPPRVALSRARGALRVAGLPDRPVKVRRRCSRASRTDKAAPWGSSLSQRMSTRTAGMSLDKAAQGALVRPAAAGADRSGHALRAGWQIWRCGGREWTQVEQTVMQSPAMRRWRQGGRAEARRRWQMESAKWLDMPVRLSEADLQLLAEVEGAALALLPADLVPVVWAIAEVARRRDRVEALPIATRDLIVWGVSGSLATAAGALQALAQAGVIIQDGDRATADAARWTLRPPAVWDIPCVSQTIEARTESEHRYTPPSVGPVGVLRALLCSPAWLHLGYGPLTLLLRLLQGGGSAEVLAADLQVSVRTVRRWQAVLADCSLVEVDAAGCLSWSGRDLSGTDAEVTALRAWRVRCSVVAAERAVWSAWCSARGIAPAGRCAALAAVQAALFTDLRARLDERINKLSSAFRSASLRYRGPPVF